MPGLRAGQCLCSYGMQVLTPTVFDLLAALGDAGRRQLSPALDQLAGGERYLAYDVQGRRYNLGEKYGLLVTQLALAQARDDRARALAPVMELLARQPQAG